MRDPYDLTSLGYRCGDLETSVAALERSVEALKDQLNAMATVVQQQQQPKTEPAAERPPLVAGQVWEDPEDPITPYFLVRGDGGIWFGNARCGEFGDMTTTIEWSADVTKSRRALWTRYRLLSPVEAAAALANAPVEVRVGATRLAGVEPQSEKHAHDRRSRCGFHRYRFRRLADAKQWALQAIEAGRWLMVDSGKKKKKKA